jgi:2-polyprenyl-3-methyl-5-hydroxy-6-metoxy-1,4-benzoquinol methylase
MPTFDIARKKAFAAEMLTILNQGALALMLSIGHRAGIFDAMRRLGPATSAALADHAGLEERYVREWLGAVTTGGIVEYCSEDGSYFLPPEHAAVLTREAHVHNLAATAQWIPLLAQVEDEVLRCFEQGGGVPYASYARFHEVMAEESDQGVVATLADAILPLVPGLQAALESGIDVLDVGCGRGRAMVLLARSFPKSRFTGVDLSVEAIAAAHAEAAECGLGNVRFEVRDAAALEARGAFNLVTAFDSIHDQARPDAVLRGVAAALRPGGLFLMQDIRGTSRLEEDCALPLAPFLYTVSCLHCMTVSLAAGGAGLGAMWGSGRARLLLEEAGFDSLEIHTLAHDPINQYYLARRPR